MNDEAKAARQSGGVNISGANVTVSGDLVGQDKIMGTEISTAQLEQIFRHLAEAVIRQGSAVVER
jgi:post-segregation antitoxin (ccd killing protein)